MRFAPALLILALASAPLPVMGQDFFGPLEDFVDTLTNPPAERPSITRPAPTGVQRPTPPPVPRPRPPDLPDVAAPTVPDVPMPEAAPEDAPAPEAEPVTEPPADAQSEGEAEPVPDPLVEPATPAAEERSYQVACPAVMMGLVEAEMAPPLSEGICGEQSPLVVTGVMSRGRMVPLSTPITTNCQMATALPRWLETVDGYAEAMLGSRLASVEAGTSYMCRNRNNAAEGFTSEHGFANALDVTGFALENGETIGVEANWLPATAAEGRLLRLAHDAGCASFTTTLGPEANAEHEDHLHLDLGCHGETCTARICE